MGSTYLGPRRGGWQRPVAVPDDLSALQGPTTGRVRLPLHLYSSGMGSGREFDLSVEADRVEFYQIVLTEGRLADVCRFVNGEALLALWPRMWLSPHVRAAWRPLLGALAS